MVLATSIGSLVVIEAAPNIISTVPHSHIEILRKLDDLEEELKKLKKLIEIRHSTNF